MITFVALLMFIQLGEGWGTSTLLCGLLTTPWLLKSFVREKVRHMGHYTLVLCLIEIFIFFALVALAFSFTIVENRTWLVFTALMILCLFCAWHELVARMYYERSLRPRQQQLYNAPKMFFSQSSTVLTYGVMILVVGSLEIFYHNRRMAIPLSWSTAIYLLAGVYLLLLLVNLVALRLSADKDIYEHETFGGALRAEMDVLDRIVHKPQWLSIVISFFLLLLPQSLMFHARVLYLIAPHTVGGLGCSLQWIGLAQGTVGVMAFSFGLIAGHRLLWTLRFGGHNTSIVFYTMAFTLGLSPVCYLLMTIWPPTTLLPICIATFFAQSLFGFGLNCSTFFVHFISEGRYRSTINYLYIPFVALVMAVPVAASGWLVEWLGFDCFFIIDTLLALLAWLAARWAWTHHFAHDTLRY